MPHPTHLEIAGVHFVIRPPAQCPFRDAGRIYRSFLTEAPAPRGGLRVALDTTLEAVPDTSRLERVFETPSWTLFREDAGYCLAQGPRGPDLPPPWLARFDRSFSRGTVHCDEFLIHEEDGRRSVVNPVLRRLDQLLVMYALAARGGVLVHSTGAIVGGRAYVFAGRSGAGKTTLARLFAASGAAKDVVLLSDDRMVLRTTEEGLEAFGTPWAGEAEVALNRSAPLAGILFLHHGASNEIRPISEREAVEQILPLVSMPWHDRDMTAGVLATCDAVVSGTPAFEFHFRPADDAITAVLDFVRQRGGGA